MPARQRGSTVRRGKTWAARYRDAEGVQRLRGGFGSKTDARAWLDSRVDDVEALRRGDVAALRRRSLPTLAELVDEFTAQHVAEPSTIASLEFRLRYALEGPKLDGNAGWRDVTIDRLNATEIGAWRKALPGRSAFGIHKCLRQVLHYAVRAKLIDENPAALVPNPEPKRVEVKTFTIDELELAAAELSPTFRAVPVFAALTGLRPCEWMALERADVDRQAGVVTVRRTVVEGVVKPYGKTERSLRAVPLPARAAQALDEHPTRLDTRVLFPGARGAPQALSPWRHREWNPALRAAGLEHRSVYALRHTYASLSIAAGVSLFELSRLMGTSPAMLDKTYGHLLPDALDRARSALDVFIANAAEAAEGGG
ncbi:MAG: site-specific integrase [Actinobacteria bacterium]|nr:site-specific integrase [Actinomycetota bacterium]